MKKNHKIGLAAFMAVLLSVAAYREVFKITDPSDPRFNPDRFSFSDYHGRDELIPVYKKLFPRGTPKEFVDRVLVKAGGAYITQDTTVLRRWSYVHPRSWGNWDGPPSDIFIFDRSGKFENVYVGTLEPPIYSSPTLKDLDEELKTESEKEHDR